MYNPDINPQQTKKRVAVLKLIKTIYPTPAPNIIIISEKLGSHQDKNKPQHPLKACCQPKPQSAPGQGRQGRKKMEDF